LQSAIGDQAQQRTRQTHPGEPEAGSSAAASPRFGHDFGRIAIHPPPSGIIPAKLVINQPRDESEQEADHVSEKVMRMPEPQRQSVSNNNGAQGQTHGALQLKRVGGSDLGQTEAPPVVNEVLRSPGQPLDATTRGFMEPRFGHDFSQIRVHADAEAAQSAHAVGARAYAVGRHIVLGRGEGSFPTDTGRRLLAHELAHVVQQEGDLLHGNAAGSLTSSLLQRAPLKGAGISRLTAAQVEERAIDLFRRAASEFLKAKGKQVTDAALRGLKKQFTVGVLQGVKDGRIVTLVACNDPALQPYLKLVKLPEETLVDSVALTAHNVRTGLPRKTGQAHAHAEPPLSQEAEV
jgi:hypothetical protein